MVNKQKISKITIRRNSHNICPIGEDWFTAQVTIEMYPDVEIPDFVDVDKFFEKNIDGATMIIEDVVEAAAEFILKSYAPLKLITTARVTDSTHSDVEVTRVDDQSGGLTYDKE